MHPRNESNFSCSHNSGLGQELRNWRALEERHSRCDGWGMRAGGGLLSSTGGTGFCAFLLPLHGPYVLNIGSWSTANQNHPCKIGNLEDSCFYWVYNNRSFWWVSWRDYLQPYHGKRKIIWRLLKPENTYIKIHIIYKVHVKYIQMFPF